MVLVSVCLMLAAGSSVAFGADLLRLVPNDAAACLHMPRLTASVDRFTHSNIAAGPLRSQIITNWHKDPAFQQFNAIRTVLEQTSGYPLSLLADELLGQEVVLALHLPEDPAAEPHPVLLLQARHREFIQTALDTWQRLDGVTMVERERGGVEYYQSTNSKQQRAFIAVLDSSLILTTDEPLLCRVLDLAAAEPESASCIRNHKPAAVALTRHDEGVVASLYINPRAWDSRVANHQDLPDVLLSAWKKCRWLTLQLSHQKHLELRLVADCDSGDTPSWWHALQLPSETTLGIDRIPTPSLVAVSGVLAPRDLINTPVVENLVTTPLPPQFDQARRVAQGLLLGLDPVNDLLPSLGPLWTLVVVPRAAGDDSETQFPLDSLVAIEFHPEASRDGDGGETPLRTRREGVDNALLTGLNLLTAVHNSRQSRQLASVHSKLVHGQTIRWASPVALFEPSYAVTERHILLATSPGLCEDYLAALVQPSGSPVPSAEPPRATPGRSPLGTAAENSSQFVYVDIRQLRQLVDRHSEWFTRRAQRDEVLPEEAARRLAELKTALELFDSAWLSLSFTDSSVTAVLAVGVDD